MSKTVNYSKIIDELAKNRITYETLLRDISDEEALWKQQSDKWSLLEIVCHLYDEEREDFRARTQQVLEMPNEILPSINPAAWVQERAYIQQNYTDSLDKFLKEREQSIEWLESLLEPKWENTYHHATLGEMSAKLFLSNWLAHDYLHTQQILRLKFDYLKHLSDENLKYASGDS